MITYEQICERNRRLFALLDTLTRKMNRDQPEGSDHVALTRQITIVKFELESNMEKLDVFLTRARDHATAVSLVSIDTRSKRPYRHADRPVRDLESGREFTSIGEAARELNANRRLLWSKLDGGIFYL